MVGELLGKDSADVSQAVRDVRAIADTSKLYVQQWIIVFTSASDDAATARAECSQRFLDKYEGRVKEDDVMIDPMFDDDKPCKHYLKLNLWTCVGEFKTKELAQEAAREFGPDGRPRWMTGAVVGRNSRHEQILKDYGVVKLTIAASKGREVSG